MPKYKNLLFDVDDTLLDFRAAEKLALRLLFEEFDIRLTDEIEAHYKKINQGLWKSFEEGKIEREEVLNTRFSSLFQAYDKDVDGALLEKSYRNYLGEGKQLVEGAVELLANLKEEYNLYIVTNGVSKTQYKRLRDSGLHPLFKDIFVSEDTGYQKPMKEFFDYVFDQIPRFQVEQSLIIGDSLNADIRGGNQVGLDTCWFNPARITNETNITPTYEIHKLEKIHDILSANLG